MLGINPDRLDIIITQLVRLIEKGKEVRMSKRKGEYVTLEELVDKVGLDIARFFFLMYSADRHMDFDLGLAKEKSEKNPVYYVQYAYARINSILKKAKLPAYAKASAGKQNSKLNLLSHPSELGLIKELIKLPEIVEDIAKDYQVQRLPHYALDVAAAFHRFYTDCRVLGDYKDLENARLALVLATKIVLENILDLMGISKPKKM
jgi:arginyl-tRNA synthetase